MSFKSKDLLIDVLPAKGRSAVPGLPIRAQGTDDDGSEPDCDATRPQKVYDAPLCTETALGALRHQLRERLSLR